MDKITFDDGDRNNYIDKIDGVGDATLCGQLCALTTACVYWTWYAPGVTDNGGYGKRSAHTCLMFDNIEDLRYNSYATSGNKYRK